MRPIARYAFLPWLRRGIANQINVPAAGASRAQIAVNVSIASDLQEQALPARTVALIGPGDVLGFNAQPVIRTEPREGTADFEPNYLAAIELYDEDFAWRYTPDAPDPAAHRLTPWLTLLVLKKGEFTRERKPGKQSSVTLSAGVDPKQLFAPKSQLWAWAHVHMNASLGANGQSPNQEQLDAVLRKNPDLGYCRMICPRRLEPETPYHAFVIPTFEVGRKAGLREAVKDSDSGLELAWQTGRQFPVYFEWSFATGPRGDFEDLVEALKARPMPKEVGIRDLDVREPGFHMPTINSLPDHVVGLEGALLSPFTVPKPLHPASNFPAEIEQQVNLAADTLDAGVGAGVGPGAGDPIVTAPLYGRWHALVERVSAQPEHRNWVNELNVDPRMRSVAGMGTRVVQRHQEDYMKLAWQQIGEVLALNRKVAFVQMAQQASHAFYLKHLVPLPQARALNVLGPIQRRVMGSPVTVHYQVRQSRLTTATFSGPMRKLLRPRGPVARRAFAAGERQAAQGQLIEQLNAGTVSPAPPRAAPSGPTLERALATVAPDPGASARWWLRNAAVIAFIVVLLLVLLAVALGAAGALAFAAVGAVATYLAYRAAQQRWDLLVATDALAPVALGPDAVARIAPNDSFTLLSGASPPSPTEPSGGPDSVEARDFRSALVSFHELLSLRSPPPPLRPALALSTVHSKLMRAIDPAHSFPKRVARTLRVGDQSIVEYAGSYRDALVPGHGAPVPAPGSAPPERIVPVMAYPDIKQPMYEPLRDLSTDLFIPNLDLIPRNTISLMVQNQPFIEAYMVGLNHEFARELLWREYPTDQRPSTFRQFWDVSNYVDRKGLPPKQLAEQLRDITRIHEWSAKSQLGDHNNRDPLGHFRNATEPGKRMVVLVIRGDLLRRYPNTVIFAQQARWGTQPGTQLQLAMWDESGERSDEDIREVRFPLYKAVVKPDIHFIGFDLTLDEVRGDPSLEESAAAKARLRPDQLGWFFTIKEVVGEPRFGLDEKAGKNPSVTSTWDNLSWQHLGAAGVIDLATPFALPLPPTPNPAGVHWNANAADTAHILYQKPILVGVHARDMLKDAL